MSVRVSVRQGLCVDAGRQRGRARASAHARCMRARLYLGARACAAVTGRAVGKVRELQQLDIHTLLPQAGSATPRVSEPY